MKQKKLMLLGGIRYLLPVIKAAHKHNIHVITVDYIPDNIAHKYSDEFHNLSILDKDAVLQLAQELKIDGIMSFGVDPGVVTAAFVAEKMNLPFQCSYEAACILQDKSRFRQFLKEHNFNVPNAKGYASIEVALKDVDYFHWPVIVKPVDSAGSKGVSRVDTPEALLEAVSYALSEAHNGHFIIEDFLEKEGFSSDSDCFTVDGNFMFCSFSDQRFDEHAENPYTPAAYSWPSTMPQWAQDELHSELQRLADLLQLRTGIYNIETRLCKDGKPYIMEVSPRGGGNRLAEMLKYATGVDLVEAAVMAALGMPVVKMSSAHFQGNFAEIILHADKDGIFDGVRVVENSQFHIVEKDLWVREGENIHGFTGANQAIGTVVLQSEDKKTLAKLLEEVPSWCKVLCREKI